jgi:plastocyanin domain-containing protein
MKLVIAALLVFSTHAFAAAPMSASAPTAIQAIQVTVDERGYTPAEIKVPVGSSIELEITRTTDDTCAKEIEIPALKISQKLPLNQTVSVRLNHLKAGQVKFGCHMNMMLGGVILVQ